MDCELYNSLPDDEQYCVLWQQGIFIKQVRLGSRLFCLYGIGNFFVEVCRNVHTLEILAKTGFKNGPQLEKYLLRLFPFRKLIRA